MTKQEIFDKVAPKLLRQNKRCENHEACVYKKGALRCAVGFLIPDGHPALEISGSLAFVHEKFPELGLGEHLAFLRDLQRIHDYRDVATWRTELLTLAERYSLDASKIA